MIQRRLQQDEETGCTHNVFRPLCSLAVTYTNQPCRYILPDHGHWSPYFLRQHYCCRQNSLMSVVSKNEILSDTELAGAALLYLP